MRVQRRREQSRVRGGADGLGGDVARHVASGDRVRVVGAVLEVGVVEAASGAGVHGGDGGSARASGAGHLDGGDRGYVTACLPAQRDVLIAGVGGRGERRRGGVVGERRADGGDGLAGVVDAGRARRWRSSWPGRRTSSTSTRRYPRRSEAVGRAGDGVVVPAVGVRRRGWGRQWPSGEEGSTSMKRVRTGVRCDRDGPADRARHSRDRCQRLVAGTSWQLHVGLRSCRR